MGNEIYAGNLGDIRGIGASKGVSLSTTAAFTGFPEGTHWYSLTPRNFATAVVARTILCPYLIIFKTTDDLATAPTDYTSAAQDNDTTTDVVLSSMDTGANGDYLYVGCAVPFRGVNIDVDGTNSTGSRTLTVKYWQDAAPDAWAGISATDGTSGSTSLDQDGSVTWTVPSDWLAQDLFTIGDDSSKLTPFNNQKLYWTRWEWNGALDSSVTLNHMLGINRSTAYAEWVAGQPCESTVNMGLGGYAGIEALTDAGTGNLLINVATRNSSRIFA